MSVRNSIQNHEKKPSNQLVSPPDLPRFTPALKGDGKRRIMKSVFLCFCYSRVCEKTKDRKNENTKIKTHSHFDSAQCLLEIQYKITKKQPSNQLVSPSALPRFTPTLKGDGKSSVSKLRKTT